MMRLLSIPMQKNMYVAFAWENLQKSSLLCVRAYAMEVRLGYIRNASKNGSKNNTMPKQKEKNAAKCKCHAQ